MAKGGYIYILANKPNGTLYVGVASDLVKRVWQHKEKCADGFTKKYEIDLLVYFEHFENIEDAIAREKAMKEWQRSWKVKRVLKMNPEWRDLYSEIV